LQFPPCSLWRTQVHPSVSLLVASCLFDRDSGGQLRWTRLDVVRPVRDAFAVSRHLLSGLEKGVSGLLFAPKRLLARRCLEFLLERLDRRSRRSWISQVIAQTPEEAFLRADDIVLPEGWHVRWTSAWPLLRPLKLETLGFQSGECA